MKQQTPPLKVIERLYELFLKMVALFLMFYCLRYWAQIVGVYEGEIYRFDTMPDYWKVVVSVLAVLMPVAALGLWGAFAWGVVIWVLVIAVEVVMYFGYPNLFGSAPAILLFHCACIATYLLFRIMYLITAKRRDAAAQ